MNKEGWPPEWAARAAARMSGTAGTRGSDRPRPEPDQHKHPPGKEGLDATARHAAASSLDWPTGDPDQVAEAVEAPPPEDHPGDGLVAPAPADASWRRYGILICAIYVLVCLGGVYADTKFLFHFDISYLKYTGLTDLLTGFLSFVRIALTPSFVIAFALLAAVLAMSITGLHYLIKTIRALARFAALGRPLAPAHEAIKEAFSEQFRDEEGFWSRTHAIIRRPYPALLIATIASFVGINVTVSAATRDLVEFADSFKNNPRTDDASYEVVAVAGRGAATRRDRVVRLGASREFAFYYDLGAARAVVMPKSDVSKDVADPAPLEPAAEEAIATVASADERSALSAATAARFDRIMEADAPADRTGAQPAPAVLGTPDSSSPERLAVQTIAAETSSAVAAGAPTMVAQASVVVEGQQSIQPTPAASPLASSGTDATDGLAAIDGNVGKSRDSLEGLKIYLDQVEGGFVKIREFVVDLDSALGAIDEAFADLEKHLAKDDAAVARASCAERLLSQPLQFEPQQADLSLASVGLLFQARRQLAVERSAERQEWLVIEAYADDGAAPASQALAGQRGEAVRAFLQTELGLPGETLRVVVGTSDGRQAGDVRIFDCLERDVGTVASAPSPESNLPLMRSASATELPDEGSPRPAVFESSSDRASDQLAMLSEELSAREDRRGLLLTVPGHLLFDTASVGIEPSGRRLLDEIGELLIREPASEVLIFGHSDAFGDAGYNLVLSERRAQSVRSHLLNRFDIDADRLRVEGRGEQDPIASNDTRDGRLANRRIEVLLIE